MSANSSLLPSALSSSDSFYHEVLFCLNTTVGTSSNIALTVTSVLLLPLYILVLYLGLQRWRQQRSGTTMSHSDLFTYHMVFVELMSVSGFCLCCWGIHNDHPQAMTVGVTLSNMNLTGQRFFHVLTCVERYLAVVHPVTYRSLKEARGIRMRNVAVGCVWLLCFAGTGLLFLANQFHSRISYCSAAFSLSVILFCNLSVLCVLIRPGPGQRVDKSKLRAFYTMMLILGVLLFRFGGNILITVVYSSVQLAAEVKCGMLVSLLWFCVPSSLVLPLLFLQRSGKLLCCKSNS